MNNNSDQIRRLQNVVILEGAPAELEEPRTGTGKDGINYISLRGAVQCGDTGVYTRSFRAFIKEKRLTVKIARFIRMQLSGLRPQLL